jgi:predicted NAD-dependent protein-ADP-ribosyltransferase YbiA (DUF1768 family)
LHFGDRDIAGQIMKTNDPYEMMSLARKIKNYNHSVWTKLAEKVLMKANSVKYSQNPDASAALIATGQKDWVKHQQIPFMELVLVCLPKILVTFLSGRERILWGIS